MIRTAFFAFSFFLLTGCNSGSNDTKAIEAEVDDTSDNNSLTP